jgi:hypothetical protein
MSQFWRVAACAPVTTFVGGFGLVNATAASATTLNLVAAD